MPASAVRSPTTSLKENCAPGLMSVPFILSEANWILCVLLSLPGLYSVVKDAIQYLKVLDQYR